MKPGRLIAVVGPSGAGKDSVIAGIAAACPDLRRVRRTITRAGGQDGEPFDPATPEDFARQQARGAFCLSWRAHGLAYGIPADMRDDLARGTDCLANLSRGVLTRAQAAFPRLVVLHVTAAPQVLARRLADRGREPAEDVAERLSHAEKPLPAGLDIVTLPNDGELSDTVARAVAALGGARNRRDETTTPGGSQT